MRRLAPVETWKKRHQSGVAGGVLIEVWADVVCPWCFLGKRRLEAALAGFEHADAVELRFRSFQLDPAAAVSGPDDEPGTAPRLARKYGVDLAEARAMNERVTALAAADGLDLRLDEARGGNTRDAHRLLHEAARHGVQDALVERLMRGYFTEGRRIDDPATLADLAAEAGLDRSLAAAVLASEAHGDAVRRDQGEAGALGVSGVPFVVLDRRYAVSGAQPAEVFRTALQRAWADGVRAAG